MSKIVDNGTFHKTLENRRPTELAVIEGIPCNCKVDLKDMEPPLIIQVRYRRKGDLLVYGSYKNQEPDAKDCDQVDERPLKIVVNDRFKSNTYYLAFTSQAGVEVSATAYFTQGPGAAAKGDGPIKFERQAMFQKREAASDVFEVKPQKEKEEEVGVGTINVVKA